jgi:hypothetical protein
VDGKKSCTTDRMSEPSQTLKRMRETDKLNRCNNFSNIFPRLYIYCYPPRYRYIPFGLKLTYVAMEIDWPFTDALPHENGDVSWLEGVFPSYTPLISKPFPQNRCVFLTCSQIVLLRGGLVFRHQSTLCPAAAASQKTARQGRCIYKLKGKILIG